MVKEVGGVNFKFYGFFISDNLLTISHFLFLENPMIFVDLWN